MGFVDNRKALPDLQLKNFDPYSSPRDDKSSFQASVDKKLPKEFDSALTSLEQKEAIGFFRKQISNIKEMTKKQNAVPIEIIQALYDQ